MASGSEDAKPCPNCGHCPTCGRSAAAWPYGLYPFWTQPTYPWWGPTWIVGGAGNTWIQPTITHGSAQASGFEATGYVTVTNPEVA